MKNLVKIIIAGVTATVAAAATFVTVKVVKGKKAKTVEETPAENVEE